MVELDDAMRRALLAYEDPPLEARAEILASLRTRLGGPSDPDSGESGPGDPGGSQVAWAAKIAAATAGLTATGLLTLKLGALAITALVGHDPPSEAVTAREPSEPIAAITPHDPADTREPSSATIATSPPAATTVARERSLAHESDADLSHEGESTLAAELVLVRAAKQLRADDREAALAQLELHRERFAKGVLAPEREALRVELLCDLGRDVEAERARERFVIDFADSTLRARVLAGCRNGGTDSIAGGD